MWHKVQLLGNLGGDPDTRYLQSGTSVCSFSIATHRKWVGSDGQQNEETIWWRVSAWGKLGEICQQYLSKGRLVFIEGEIVPDRETGGPRLWTDQNGQQRASFEIRADTMKMLGGGRDDSASYSEPRHESRPEPRAESRSEPRTAAPAGRTAQRPPAAAPARPTQPSSGGRRSTMSAPQSSDFDDDQFDADEIPF